jgi:hypothetical protein
MTKTRLETKQDPSGLFWTVTVIRSKDGRKAMTTLATKPEKSHPTVKRLIQSLNNH